MKEKTINNIKTGQRLTFIHSEKDLLEIESSWSSAGKEPPAHYHPHQEEVFTIIKGRLSVRINGEVRDYAPGEVLAIPKNTIHSMWNNSDTETIANWKITPSMKTEDMLRTFFGLANDGKTNADGVPGILQVALTVSKYSDEMRLTKPAYSVLKYIFLLLSPMAYLTGRRATYPKYLS